LGETIDRHFVSAGPPRLALAQALRRALGRASYVPAKRLQTLDAAARFEEGLDAYARFEYEDARTAFAAAAVLDPRNALLAAWRSRVATVIRRDDEASEMATQAVRLTSDGLSPRARLFVESVVAEVRHDFTTAEARLRDVIEADPANPAAMMELGFFLDRRLDTPRAIETFSGALKADARMPRAHLELCRMYSPARQNESANAVTQGNQALSAYRALGDRSGEAQALMCLVDTLRVGNPSDRQTAKQSADTARAILEADRASYQLPRAHYYVALVFGAEGNLSAAAEAFETSLAKAQAGGNVLLQPLLQMNLGVAHTALGHHARAAQYYSDSSKAYEVLGDEQRAAQIQANASALAIEYGPDPTQGLREMQNALSVSRKLGDKNFEVFCLQVIAAYYRDAGDQAASERSLNQALAISRERNLNHHVVPLTVDIARSRLETGDYATAKTLLMQALGDGKGPAAVQARLYLAHVDIHLGDFASANEELMAAAREVEGGGDTELTPLLHELRGELSYESGHLNDARAHFAAASQLWTDDRPDAASVEARAYLGLLDGLSGQADQGMRQIRESLEQAQRMERLGLQAQCRVFLARVALHARRPDDANIALQGVAADGERAVGRELQAQVHYWRSQVQAVHSDRTQQASESDAARKLLRDLQQSLPDPDRARFGARPDVQMILG